jgi:acyl transferase domain-containing protein
MWDFIINKKDARSVVPASRYNIESWFSEKEKPGTVNTRHGYFIDNDPSTMDTSLFSMTQVELERTDPQQRQLLELAREVVEDAGIVNWRGSKTGVWVGNFSEDWSEIMDKDSQQYGVHRIIGQSDFALANRISYEMDLQGPRYE